MFTATSPSREGTPSGSLRQQRIRSRNSTAGLRSPTPSVRGQPQSHQPQPGAVRPVKSRRQLRSAAEDILVQDELHTVSVLAPLPVEVQQIINASNLYSDYVHCSLNFSANFGCAVSKEYVYAWPIQSRASNGTCSRFPCPLSATADIASSVFAPVPLATIVDYGSAAREPGMLIIGLLGQIRYWPTLSMALTGVDRFSPAQISLDNGEIIRHLVRVTFDTFVLSTSSARLYRISLSIQNGRSTINVSTLARSRGMLSRLGSTLLLGGSIPLTSSLGVVALASSSENLADGSRVLWAVKQKSVEAWKIHSDKAGDSLYDEWEGVDTLLQDALLNEDMPGILPQTLDMQILDAKSASTTTLAMLVSHTSPIPSARSRSFALLTVAFGNKTVSVTSVVRLSRSADPDPRPLSQPQLVLTADVAFIIFADSVVFRTENNEESVNLKSVDRARYLGHGLENSRKLALVTATNGILRLEALHPLLDDPNQTLLQRQTAKLAARLERAVFFEHKANNPLSFDVGAQSSGNLNEACQSLSASLLSSSCGHLQSPLEMRSNLAEREERMRELGRLLNEHELIDKLSLVSRASLLADLQRVAIGSALWQLYSSSPELQGDQSVLLLAIAKYGGSYQHDDAIRTFFASDLARLNQLFDGIDSVTKNAIKRGGKAASQTQVLLQAGTIWHAIFQAAQRVRSDNLAIYRLANAENGVEPWISQPNVLDALTHVFNLIETCLSERSRDIGLAPAADSPSWGEGSAGSVDAQQTLKALLVALADHLLSAYEGRLLYLQINSASTKEYNDLHEQYLGSRPAVIMSLVNIGRSNHAYAIAETHGDFATLAAICRDPVVGSSAKTVHYIEKYKDDFAFHLYNRLLEHGELSTLLKQDDAYTALLSGFFARVPQFRLDWVHNLRTSAFDMASQHLSAEAQRTTPLKEKKLMFSIAKLSSFATVATPDSVWQASTYNRGLEDIEIQSCLGKAMRNQLDPSAARYDKEQVLDALFESLSHFARPYPALAERFRRLLSDILDGIALSVEDLADAYSLQSGTFDPYRQEMLAESAQDEGVRAALLYWNFAPALSLVSRATNLPSGRAELLLASIWRRIYLRDESVVLLKSWQMISSSPSATDEQMSSIIRATALFQTLQAARHAGLPANLILAPVDALTSATLDELQGRYNGAPLSELQALLSDYDAESRDVERLIESCRLQDFFHEAKRIASI